MMRAVEAASSRVGGRTRSAHPANATAPTRFVDFTAAISWINGERRSPAFGATKINSSDPPFDDLSMSSTRPLITSVPH
jgi:hypothetical protein